MDTSSDTHGPVRFGSFELDVRSRELRKGSICIRLQEQPFEILRMMLERPGRVVTRDELRQRLWPDGTFVDFEHSLNAAVKRLRAALGDDADQPQFVETLPRRGYRFIATLDNENPVASVVAVPPGQRVRLAVLPFTYLSGESGQEYFTDGMTEEMIAQLGLVYRDRIGVIARSSSMVFKGTTQRAREIGQALRADYLLEGSVRREGDRLRITARLVETSGETHLWVETYERKLTDYLSVQADVAARIARSLAIELQPEGPPRKVSPDVFLLDLKGRHRWHQRTETSFREAVKLFEEAIGLDPTYAPAHVGLAESLNMLANYGIVSPRDVRPRARAAIRRALELDNASADAHRVLAFIHWQFEFEWDAAIAEYEQAIALDPNSATTVYWFGTYLGVIGWFGRSYELLDRAEELDPLSLLVPSVQGWVRFFSRRFDAALPFYRKVLSIDPDYHVALWFLGETLVELGAFDEGIAALVRALELSGRSSRLLGYLGYAYGRAGRKDAALELLVQLEERARERYVPSYFPALVLSGLERNDAALDRLEQAYHEGDTMLRDLKADPHWDRMRTEPRFEGLMRRMAFPATR